MPKKRILILGAGLAGLSTAWHLQRKGIDCQVFEKEAEVGGLCRSKHIGGFTFDCDGHLLHFKYRYTFELIKGLLGDNLAEHQRSAWIYSYGRYTRYPFQVNLYGLPPRIIKDCLTEFVHTINNGRLKKEKNLSFLDWVNSTFGKGIARHFMLPYNTKFWALPPERLTCEWLDSFIPVPSLSEIIEGTVEDSRRQFGYNARFWYPKKGGIAQIALGLASQVENIHTNCQITEIDLAKKEIKTASGDKERFDCLVSTLPLPEMPGLIKDMPEETTLLFKKLKWNSILNLNFGIDKKNNSRMHWVYFPQEDVCFFRAGFFHNFSPYLAPAGKSSLYVEVAYSNHRPLNKNDIILRVKKDLKKTGVLSSRDDICAQDRNDIKYGYPVYDTYYRQARDGILKYLTRRNILPCGRYGSWRYFSMEDSILDGERLAKELISL